MKLLAGSGYPAGRCAGRKPLHKQRAPITGGAQKENPSTQQDSASVSVLSIPKVAPAVWQSSRPEPPPKSLAVTQVFIVEASSQRSEPTIVIVTLSLVSKRTVRPIELVLDIFATSTNPGFVEATNSQELAIRKNKGFSSVIDPKGHMLFNLDRAGPSSLIGHNDFGGCALKLSTRSLRLTRLRRRGQDGDR